MASVALPAKERTVDRVPFAFVPLDSFKKGDGSLDCFVVLAVFVGAVEAHQRNAGLIVSQDAVFGVDPTVFANIGFEIG